MYRVPGTFSFCELRASLDLARLSTFNVSGLSDVKRTFGILEDVDGVIWHEMKKLRSGGILIT